MLSGLSPGEGNITQLFKDNMAYVAVVIRYRIASVPSPRLNPLSQGASGRVLTPDVNRGRLALVEYTAGLTAETLAISEHTILCD